MKNLLIILFVGAVAFGCGTGYSKDQLIGDWEFKNSNNELNRITFTQDSIFAWDEISGDTRRFIFQLNNDSILMLVNINGNERLADFGIINSINENEVVIESNNYKAILKRIE